MIGGVSAVSNAYAPYAISSARRAGGAEQPFAVSSSALRTKETPAADPAADSVTLSRDFPQLFASATYAPPPAQQMQMALGAVQESPAAARAGSGGFSSTPGLGEELSARAGGEPSTGAPDGTEAIDNPLDIAEELSAPGEAEELMNAAGEASGEAEDAENAESTDEPGEPNGADGEDLDEGEQAQLSELKNRDREVRAHEMAHQAVGGAFAGGASYEYQQGPDGQRYAVGGEVSIDMSAERDPQATIAKMQQVKAAAMAPAQPSGQDRAVAASAASTEMQARAELSAATAAEASGETGEAGETGESSETGANGESARAEEAGSAANGDTDSVEESGLSANGAGIRPNACAPRLRSCLRPAVSWKGTPCRGCPVTPCPRWFRSRCCNRKARCQCS
jgi:hypothetical protein